MDAGNSRLISSVVVDRERGWITFVVSPGLDHVTFGRCYVKRRLTSDEAISIRKILSGKPAEQAPKIIARYLSMPLGEKIKIKLPV